MDTASSLTIYNLPHLFDSAVRPQVELIQALKGWVKNYYGDVRAVLDPACGTGHWLEVHAPTTFLGGNDIEPVMIDFCRQKFSSDRSEFVLGNMNCLTSFRTDFDVAINIGSSIGHLQSDSDVVSHLRSLSRILKPGGVYFLGLYVAEGEKAFWEPFVRLDKTVQDNHGNQVRIRCTNIARDHPNRRLNMRVEIAPVGIDVPSTARIEWNFHLRTFPKNTLLHILSQVDSFCLQAVHSLELEEYPPIRLQNQCGEVTLVLRKSS